ncbi:hypothetical protein ZWY2020_016278 [Hordeum vulgare]|nr:hypothetical protein ZWY2020_016278 [Hordeum vulgare]
MVPGEAKAEADEGEEKDMTGGSNHKVTSSAGAQLPSMAGEEAPTTEAACQDLVEILDEGSGRLDMGRYVDHVRDLSAGAIATFEGTTRDHLDGRRVVELR